MSAIRLQPGPDPDGAWSLRSRQARLVELGFTLQTCESLSSHVASGRELNDSKKRDPDRTRSKLLDVAIAEFSARGFHGVSVDEIVKRAGVNKRMVYHYFGSKDGIYRAAILSIYSRLEDVEFKAVRRGTSPEEKLRAVMEAYFNFNRRNPEFARIILWENLNEGKALDDESGFAGKNPFLEQFRQIIKEGVADGSFRDDLDIRHLLIQFIGLCFIYFSNAHTLSHTMKMKLRRASVLKQALDHSMELIFRGIRSEDDAGIVISNHSTHRAALPEDSGG